MKKTLISLAVITILSGCAVIQSTGYNETDPTVTNQRENIKKEFDSIPAPAAGKPISVAVYSFSDKTGQRRPQANIASLSTAVTQGAETFLIKALTDVGRGQWFEVVERVGIDNLTKERLIIRQMREAYEGANAKPLMPMQFAGIIVEGGIVGYDSSTTSGGAGMRVFGIGKQTQWSTDTVTVSLRAVSVNTGKVVASVTVQKTILSTGDSASALKFYDQGTKAFEAEMGLTINEPGTYAVKAATEMAVVELIKEGQRKGVWDYRHEPVAEVIIPKAPQPLVTKTESSPVISSEIKAEAKVEEKKDVVIQQYKSSPEIKAEANVEEKKDVVVQPQTSPETKTETAPSATTEVKKEPVALFGNRQLKDNAFLHSEQDEKSTRKWWVAKGTTLSVLQPGSEGWVRVKTEDGTNRGGWIRIEKIEEVKQ